MQKVIARNTCNRYYRKIRHIHWEWIPRDIRSSPRYQQVSGRDYLQRQPRWLSLRPSNMAVLSLEAPETKQPWSFVYMEWQRCICINNGSKLVTKRKRKEWVQINSLCQRYHYHIVVIYSNIYIHSSVAGDWTWSVLLCLLRHHKRRNSGTWSRVHNGWGRVDNKL